MNHPYVKREFRKWLVRSLSANPKKPVGRSCGSDLCPLKKCFGVAVDELNYRIPKWADEYIWQQDAVYSNGKVRSIYPKRALEILDGHAELV